MPFSQGYDLRMQFSFGDGLGKTYIAIAVAWSAILLSGIAFLIRNRNLPFLRIRNVRLVVSAVATLHVYWVLCLVAYGLEGYFPCRTEFWIMSIYLPLGIALFHASNSQLLHIAALQQNYASTEGLLLLEKSTDVKHRKGWRGYIEKLRAQQAVNKTMTYIGIGMILQVCCTLVIFCISKRFNRWGVVGHSLPDNATSRGECRRGWEWLPSILWQFFWAWIYAPYLLWKVRGIKDVHSWRIQTVCCCIAGLPASPMWLMALYLPEMRRVNKYFIPPLWFAASIFIIEACMIFVPCWRILRTRKLRNDTLAILNEWEQHKNGSSIETDLTRTNMTSRLSYMPSLISTTSSRKAQPHMYTMIALEKALRTNPTPLLLFAALKDFSGENISFLIHVHEWKAGWSGSHRPLSALFQDSNAASIDPEVRRTQFNKAVEIYSSFVSLKYSKFPINISHNELHELQEVFEASAATVNTGIDHSNAATPFEDHGVVMSADDLECGLSKDGRSTSSSLTNTGKCFAKSPSSTVKREDSIVDIYQMKNIGDKLPAHSPIPNTFGPHTFDRSVESIKYTVLTNTWPKFVNAGYANKLEKSTVMDRFHTRVSDYRAGWSRLTSL